MKTLSKTNYLVYRDCKKNAWLKKNRPDIYMSFTELSEFDKSIIETGNEVEQYARKFFPADILYQPEFEKNLPAQAGGFFCAVDFLEKLPDDSYNIYEVKASNETKESVHLYDLAFQYILLKDCGLKIMSANLTHLNSAYVRHGELEIDKLFVSEDLTEQIKEIEEEVRGEMDNALKYISQVKEPEGWCECMYKGRSNHCTTFNYSNKEIRALKEAKESVHDIARIGSSKAKLTELINSEIFNIKDIPERIKLSGIQQNQVNAHILDKITINKMKIAEELDALSYPLYFLDYETFPAAIPRFDDFSPYQQIPFQFSLHILRSRASGLEHYEFLHMENTDPSLAFAEALQKSIGSVGSVIVWHKSFESGRNNELADRLPEFRVFMDSINARMYDLEDIFKKQYYIHKDFHGSSSIKNILPVLAPDLSYKGLAIKEGGSAAEAWNQITTGDLSPSEKKEIAQNLLKYCELDTYAMYAIWRKLSPSVKSGS